MTLMRSHVVPATPCRSHHADDERLALLRCLLADRTWAQDAGQRARLQQVQAALRAPGLATLDEDLWMLLADATARYLEFRRQQSLERQLHGLHEGTASRFAPHTH